MDIIHCLKLDRTFTGTQNLGSETHVDVELQTSPLPSGTNTVHIYYIRVTDAVHIYYIRVKVETHYGDIERASERASKSLPTLPVFSTKRSVLAC